MVCSLQMSYTVYKDMYHKLHITDFVCGLISIEFSNQTKSNN